MEERFVGRTGLRVSRLGLGTLGWGRDVDAEAAGDLLRQFVDAGGTLVDTAASYGGGASESVLGELVGRRVAREDVIVCTKAGVDHRRGGSRLDTSRGSMLAALDASLLRLGCGHVDLWLAQAWSDAAPPEETLSALEYAVRSGRVRYAGVANYTGWQTALAAATAPRVGGGVEIAATEVEYSLVQRGVEREVMPACEALGVGVLAWSPLGRGVLTGKYRGEIPADSRAASPSLAEFVREHLDERANAVVQAVCTAADGLGVDPAAVALAWARDRPQVSSLLLGARTPRQLAQSLTSEDLVLPIEITRALDDVSAPDLGYPELL